MSEQLVNGSLADLLKDMSPRSHAYAETPCFVGSHRCPDIVVTRDGRQPVVIENEWLPASTVEAEARSRLGEDLDPAVVAHAGTVRSVVALRTPRDGLDHCKTPAELKQTLRELDVGLEFALLAAETGNAVMRFPAAGFVSGTVKDLSVFVDHAGVSAGALRKAISVLERGVADVVGRLRDAAAQSEDWKAEIAVALRQDYDEPKLDQMLGIAATIIINAMVFQEGLAGNRGVRNLAQLKSSGELTQAGMIEAWDRILRINYWSIFHLARELLAGVNPPREANGALKAAAKTASSLVDLGVARSHDLAGVVFQRFVGDRKYLASFYTRPEAAALLAHLAIPDDVGLSPEQMTAFRVADYACGTGTLIHAAYHRLTQLHEIAGGDPASLHGKMIEDAVTACDIVPSAAHLTAAMLSSVHPTVLYEKARVIIAEYGQREKPKRIAIGSLDLLSDSSSLPSLFPMSAPEAISAKSGRAGDFAVDTPPSSQDLVIMNPPFTRAMSDWESGAEGQWKQYRGLGTTPDIQRKMDESLKALGRGTCHHGSAGIASAFVAVADKMCKIGGTVAFVLPLTAIQGMSWSGVRKLFASRYDDVVVLGLAGARPIDQSWSADTKMAEVLLVARKAKSGKGSGRGVFVTLARRPSNAMEATEAARAVERARSGDGPPIRRIEDGPLGGTVLQVGKDRIGEAVEAPLTEGAWECCPVSDVMVVQAAHQLARGTLWLPTAPREDAPSVPVRPVGEFAEVGWADNNIANNKAAPFDRHPMSGEPAYPMLWRNRAAIQRQMVVAADTYGLVRDGREAKAQQVWRTRSWVHQNRDFSFTSQSLAAAFTTTRTIGGRGWPNIRLPTQAHEKAYCLWGNSTLGLFQYWYHASKQQIGRGLMPVTAIRRMPFLDVTALEPDQLAVAEAVFEEMRDAELKPAYLADSDAARRQLDKRVLSDVMGLEWALLEEPLAVLRRKWCAEPSVRAGKRG